MKEEHIVIGIEGLVGAGKTSICRELLNSIPNSILLHGGNLYRAIVYSLLATGKSIEKLREEMKNTDINQFIKTLNLEIKVENKETVIYINGKLVPEEELQSEKSSYAVSAISEVADNSQLYCFGEKLIDGLKDKYNIIFSGRAIMQIYPKTDYHFFITASLEERVRRKCIQYKEDKEEEIERIKTMIEKRDQMQENAGFYNLSPHSITVDVTECKSAKESANKVKKYMKLK
ncbi:MAG: (d)CMP kinase [Clostridia bacterium]